MGELALPRLGSLGQTDVISDDGAIAPRVAANSLRLQIVPTDVWDAFAVQVFVDEVEMTSRGAGMGMGPLTLLLPENRLAATAEPHVAPIARCECGESGCGVTDVRIVRDGGVVHWDWLIEVPMPHGVTFDAEQYDSEVARFASDRRWERPEDFVNREIVGRADHRALERAGLKVSAAWPDHRRPERIQVSLATVDQVYQVFFYVGFDQGSPGRTVDEALCVLATRPSTWTAEYHAIQPGVKARPPMAGTAWTRFDFDGRVA